MALPVLALLLALGGAPARETVTAGAPVQTQRPLIALTFDDGPQQSCTAALLDGLARRGVPATFFLIGEQVIGSEGLVERMEAEGHQIGIHTYGHVMLTGLNRADFDAQVEKTRAVLEYVLGRRNFMLRPPYGLWDEGVRAMAECPIILWSIDPEDWKYRDAARVAEHIVSHAFDGAIVLLHDIYPTSVEAALRAVDTLQAKGYEFVTVEELFARRGIEPQDGQVYRMADLP